MKRYWKDTWQYQRILEILDDYWQTEKDEKFVCVTMYFEHADGQYQEKQIIWENPNYEPESKEPNSMSLANLMDVVGTCFGGTVMLHRDQDGKVVGLKNLRTGHVDYFK